MIHLKSVSCRTQNQILFEDGLTVDIKPGLTLVRGGEGRGKTSLLRLLAGRLSPCAGRLERSHALTVVWNDPTDPQDEQQTGRSWLRAQVGCFAQWNEAAADEAMVAFRLDEHLDKRLFMLSTGTRRKLALVMAWASGADLVLLDQPFAALDGRSREALLERFRQQMSLPAMWVVADYEWPEGLATDPPNTGFGVIDLGD